MDALSWAATAVGIFATLFMALIVIISEYEKKHKGQKNGFKVK